MRRILGLLTAVGLILVVAVACKPTVTSPTSSNVTHSRATLSSWVIPWNHPTTYFFEYGTTTSYGSVTATHSAGSGGSAVQVSAVAQDLLPNTTYHYRFSATNKDGTELGADATFTTAACSPGTTITITSGGTYSGCYVSTSSSTPAVTIQTTSPVEFAGARIEHEGIGIKANWDYQADLNIHDSTLIATEPDESTCTVDNDCGYSVYAYKTLKLKYEHNFDKNSTGVFWSAPDVTPTVGLYRYNKVVNTGRWLGSDPWLAHAFQTNNVSVGGLEVAWNEFRNTYGQSDVEDPVNFYNSNGTSTAWWDVHHNLFDGGYPTTTGVVSYTGAGLVLGDAGGSYQKAHENIFVSMTNKGVGIPAGDHLEIYSNVVVNDGLAGGVITGPTFGQGVTVWDNPSYAGSPSNVSAHDNQIGNMRPVNSTTLERADKYLPACATDMAVYDSADDTACPNNNAISGTIDATTEATARAEADAARIAAGVTTGPS